MTQREFQRMVRFAATAREPLLPKHLALQARAIEAAAQREWFGYLMGFGSHERVLPFLSVQRTMTDAEYWSTLADIWVGAEWFQDSRPLWEWLFLQNRPVDGAHAMMQKEERVAWESLPSRITVYRGQQRKDDPLGFSWTLSRAKAAWFAERYRPRFQGAAWNGSGSPVVLVTEIAKTKALALLNQRSEEEVVVPPNNVERIAVEQP